MLSLIITVIAIALVAVLAAATVFYGGDILVSQQSKAAAATLDAQAQQIYAASVAFGLDHGNQWPANVAVLTLGGTYLSNAPVPPPTAFKVATVPNLVSTAIAGPANIEGLPALSRDVGEYLADASALASDFSLPLADAQTLQRQLQDAAGTATGPRGAEWVLRTILKEQTAQAASRPSMLDYTWRAAVVQSSRNRYMWVPSKVNVETCKAVNLRWHGTTDIPATFADNGSPIQCFGDAAGGYSYFWLAPGADLVGTASVLGLATAAQVGWGPSASGGSGSGGSGSGGSGSGGSGSSASVPPVLVSLATVSSCNTSLNFEIQDPAVQAALADQSSPIDLQLDSSVGSYTLAKDAQTYNMNSVVATAPYTYWDSGTGQTWWSPASAQTTIHYWFAGYGNGGLTAYYAPAYHQLVVNVESWNCDLSTSTGSLSVTAGSTVMGAAFDSAGSDSLVACGPNWDPNKKTRVSTISGVVPFSIGYPDCFEF